MWAEGPCDPRPPAGLGPAGGVGGRVHVVIRTLGRGPSPETLGLCFSSQLSRGPERLGAARVGLSGPDTFCATYKRSSGFKAKAGEAPPSSRYAGPRGRTAGQRKERPGREPPSPCQCRARNWSHDMSPRGSRAASCRPGPPCSGVEGPARGPAS